MKQILQNLRNGETLLVEVPAPAGGRGYVTIRTRKTLVSVGTEKMLVEFGKGNLIQKALQQPDKVRQVVDKIKTDGLVSTLTKVKNKLDTPLPLGYCNVGIVAAVGDGVDQVSVGDRVVSNGHHAESVVVPKNLCVKIPDQVDDDSAAFTVLGAIALQGIRLLEPTIGETFVVTGLGLIGLLAVQILKANGCQVIGLDFDAGRRELAKSFGAEVIALDSGVDPVAYVLGMTGVGVDGVLLTASTKSNEPVAQAAQMCRQRGRVVLIGVVGLELSRADFYEKEISFQVSCSYGPGRYDPEYEAGGKDYPLGFVRWTEARNFSAILSLMAEGKIRVDSLISHRFAIDDAKGAYECVGSGALGILLQYPRWQQLEVRNQTVPLLLPHPGMKKSSVKLGFLGAGNYAAAVLVPAFAKTGVKLGVIAAPSGVSCAHLGNKYGFAKASSDNAQVLEDGDINAVVITTRHDSHAQLVIKALGSNKHVFVEKPLAMSEQELADIESLYGEMALTLPVLMVGFNRRYSPHVKKIKSLLAPHLGLCAMVMTINAGHIDAGHWTQDRVIGGGRIIGEVCHFIDLARFLAGSPITSINAVYMDSQTQDSVVIALRFDNGAIASINYLCNGSKSFAKERLEVFAAGGILQLDNFKTTRSYRWPGFKGMRSFKQDKGQQHCVEAFVQAIERGDRSDLIPVAELFEVTRACLVIADQLAYRIK